MLCTRSNHKDYLTLEKINNGKKMMKTDDHKFVIQNSVYEKTVENRPRWKYESDFLANMKVPEEANVVQPPVSANGR